MFVCLFVCQHSDVRLTSPPVLMLWGTQGYLWLPYDLTEVIKLTGETFAQWYMRVRFVKLKVFKKLLFDA